MHAKSFVPVVLPLALSFLACSSGSDGGRFGGTAGRSGGLPPDEEEIEVSSEINRDVDILFMIDNSSGTSVLQAKLIQSFETFMGVLRSLPGGLPNVHIAVVTSDIGAGAYDVGDIPSCRHGGNQGIFQNEPRGTTCLTGSLNPGEHFISNVNGQGNYTGSIEDVFGCIAAVGDNGCGFEHQFGSVLRALGADGNGGAPVENANFLRYNAYLAVVFVTDEDDCSAPINSFFPFDPTSRYVSDPLGPLASFRCNEYGHLCGGKKPSRTMGADLSGTCTSAEDGRLLRVADVAQALKLLKPDAPSKVLVTAIAGPPAPYVVELGAPVLADDPSRWPAIKHSCTAADGTYADPGIRMRELVDAFRGDGVFQSACSNSLAPALQRIAEEVGQKTSGVPCLGKVFDANPGMLDVQPTCTVVDHLRSSNGRVTDVVRKSCIDTGGAAPCWELGAPTVSCLSGQVILKGLPSQSTTFTCKVCAEGDTRTGCLYYQ